MARLLAAYPSQIYEGWSPSPPSQEAAANTDPLTQLGLSQLYPELFGAVGPSPGLGQQSGGSPSNAQVVPDDTADVQNDIDDPSASLGVGGKTLPQSGALQLDPPAPIRFAPTPPISDVDTNGLIPSDDLQQSLPARSFFPNYQARPGDSISTIIGSSNPQAVGQFAIQNGLRSSAIRAGQTYVVPGQNQPSDPCAGSVGQTILDQDNTRLARPRQERWATPTTGIWVSGEYYPADQMGQALAALTAPVPLTGLDAIEARNLAEDLRKQRLDELMPPPPESAVQKASRAFWLTISDHHADNAGEFFGGLANEVWNNLPGLEPALNDLPFLLSGQLAARASPGEVLVDAEPYGDLVPELQGTGIQAHHLNQDAAYGSQIAYKSGLAVRLEGDALTQPGMAHFNFHSALEKFWAPYRSGELKGEFPTNGQYGAALEDALGYAGASPRQAALWADQAARQRVAHGLLETDAVPRIPGRLPQARSR